MQSDAASSNNTDFKITQNKNKKEASKNITLALVINSWRLKREEVKSLRATLAGRTSREDQLQLQVSSLRSLLQADCSKLRQAMAEVKRLREELNTRCEESQAFENEKCSLQRSASLAAQRASGLQELWRSCKGDLAAARAQAAQAHDLLGAERTKLRQAKERNQDLEDSINQNKDDNMCLENELKKARMEIIQFKGSMKIKEEEFKLIELELTNVKRCLQEKTAEEEYKSNELEQERNIITILHSQIEDLKMQLQAANEKLQRWPFYFSPWPLHCSLSVPSNVGTWWGTVTQKLLNMAMIFTTR